ncbi:VOC family protein [Umboniibacter marinipuniceus]|uniref:Glyoxalase-like protein n=1 Tax=Umboniibacter marinipuniceus TaxID=569599 RepID=A0A3M0AEN5_9GAMM|nr:VOC family protein [Umboniibacter marinipuniceus]RMA82614.1 glyoxalase-like protein [Umboniibacter marinipuniceus]
MKAKDRLTLTAKKLLSGLFLVGFTASSLTVAEEQSDNSAPVVKQVDHILYAAPDLETGMDEIEQLLGVRPAIGGKHPQYGTHNALLSLGNGQYFEVIAADPEASPPIRGMLFDIDSLDSSRLIAWVMQVDDLANQEAKYDGAGIGAVSSGVREQPDGTVLHWALSDPYALSPSGAIPALIDWGNTPHPSTGAPLAGELVSFAIYHPNPNEMTEKLAILGVDLEVKESAQPRLVVRIKRLDGQVVEIE